MSKNEEISTLRDMGWSVEDVAKALDLPLNEVQDRMVAEEINRAFRI